LLGRRANSLAIKVKGRIKALDELKDLELKNLYTRCESLRGAISAISDELGLLKVKASRNGLSDQQLRRLRHLKGKKHRLCQKLNRLSQQMAGLEAGRYSLCFGSKRLFKAQYYLEENGYGSHSEWRRDWRRARSNSLYFVGASAEKRGNQNCQYDIKAGMLKIRKDTDELEYIVLKNVKFKYGSAQIQAALELNQPLTYQIKRKKHKYYLYVSVSVRKPTVQTLPFTGAIGLDYNAGFIQQCDVSRDGNIVSFTRRNRPDKSHKGKSETARRQSVKEIVSEAVARQCPVIAEKLSFGKKKSQPGKSVSRNKRYNKMLNSFDYARYIEYLQTECYKRGVSLVLVNPYNTSAGGKKKYSKIKGVNTHQAASYVIGRKGLGYRV
jgi:IS605 OrfB family transposase